MNKYRFTICKIDGEWMDEDDAIEEYGMSYMDMVEECFDIEVEAENWRDAREKIKIAHQALSR